jgi:lipopolysaccharide export system protein LptA
MKLHLSAFLLLALLAGIRAAEPRPRPASTNAPGATNSLVITCEGGFQLETNYVIYRKNVRAQDSQTYLECEQLTAWKTTNAPKPAAVGAETGPNAGDIERIVAETNVMMITAEMQVIGDLAVYSATDDVLIFTGQLVVAVTPQGSFAGTNIVFNRRTGQISGDGPITTILYGSLTRTNALAPGPKPK